jgi:hypothetical protein
LQKPLTGSRRRPLVAPDLARPALFHREPGYTRLMPRLVDGGAP